MEVFLLNIILIALCILLVDQYGADSPDTKSITNETTGMQIKQKQQVLSPCSKRYNFWMKRSQSSIHFAISFLQRKGSMSWPPQNVIVRNLSLPLLVGRRNGKVQKMESTNGKIIWWKEDQCTNMSTRNSICFG